MLDIVDAVIRTIEEHDLIPEQGRLVVAVSGGADSLCLLHVLHHLCGTGRRYEGVQLHVAHLDHQLRAGASEQEAAAVARIAQAWDLPVTLGRVDVPALARQKRRSLEDAARTARYGFLRAVAQGDLIAVAHHMDDQVETLLLHWLRGGGLASMVGLQPRQQDIVRPLLSSTHAQTLAYCAEHQLPVLEDASNSDTRFLRNRIRHELLPLLEAMNPGFRETLLRNADVMQVDLAWIEEQVAQYWPKVVAGGDDELDERGKAGDVFIRMHIHALLALPLSLLRHLLRHASAQLSAGQSPLELRHYRLIEDLVRREPTNETLTLHLPHAIHVVRTGDILVFKHTQSGQPEISGAPIEAAVLTLPGQVAVPGTQWIATADYVPRAVAQQLYPALRDQNWDRVWKILPTTRYAVYVDADRLKDAMGQDTTLHVRTRRAGDRLQPLGMRNEKKVQDVLVDKHIAREERARIPLFFSTAHCVWLAGVQLDDRVRLTGETREIIRLAIHRS
ncbi:MAG: tRNA lysidine(34) synthetase TilS [Ktedonobacteraceae bacterium]